MAVQDFVPYEKLVFNLRAMGMSIFNSKAAIDYLVDYTSFSVIEGHSNLFFDSTNPRHYKNGTSFAEIQALHHFDETLRRSLTHYVLRVETIVRGNAVYAFCNAKDLYGCFLHSPNGYLDIANYDQNRKYDAAKAIEIFREVLEQGLRTPGPIQRWRKSHDGCIPLLVAATGMSFGHTLKFVRALKPSEREAVAKRFSLHEQELVNFMSVLRDFRNVLAHSGSVYSFRTIHRIRGILCADGTMERVEESSNRLFGSVLFILKHLLPKRDFSSLINELSTLFCGLSEKLHTISSLDVARVMGIPSSMRTRYGLKMCRHPRKTVLQAD